jgi:hypothetical protein
MGDVIDINFGPGRLNDEAFADERVAEAMKPLRADFDSAGLSEEQRAQFQSIARGLVDQIVRQWTAPVIFPMPRSLRATQAEIDVILAIHNDAMEELYNKVAKLAADTFVRTARAACAMMAPKV